jgi:Protein of unknown function (DUF3047)
MSLVFACAILGGCSSTSLRDAGPHSDVLKTAFMAPPALAFSNQSAEGVLHGGWVDLLLGVAKKPTDYRLRLDPDTGRKVLFARSSKSASGMMFPVRVKLEKGRKISWRWKVSNLIKDADNTSGAHEDSPVRIVLAFEGDKDKLGFRDQLFFETAGLLTGQELPYATLMYIWENKLPVGSILKNAHTGRVQMIVAESGPTRVGEWIGYTRDIERDFFEAFGEKAGALIAVGILSDTDNTGGTTEAYYGDIRLHAEAP